jgi:hypothetical protein
MATMMVVLVSVPLMGVATVRIATDPQSTPLARELVALASARGLQAVAAPDPDAPDRFVAALVFPDVQLLVVAARHPSPVLVQSQLARREFREVYTELQEAPIKETKLFFQDLGADGIGAAGDNVDVMYERGVDQTLFDGNWKKARLSKSQYDERVTAADARYSRLLEILIGSLKTS